MRAALLLIALLLAAAVGFAVYQRGLPSFGEAETPRPALAETQAGAGEATGRQVATPVPRFDIVRVSRDGFAVIAGRGVPGGTIEVLANGEPLAREVIGGDGAWVVNTETPLGAGPVELTLRQTAPGPDAAVVYGEETVIIYVPERDGDAPVVLRTTPGGATEVLQRASDALDALGPLAIESIDYDETDSVIFAGRGTPGALVQLFLDGQPLGDPVTVDADGRWSVPSEVPPGRYRLSAVQYGEDGAPQFAVEVPFERARLADVRRTDGGIVVQPGNNLWVISRAVYGEGRQYTVIFAANMDQIEDPDLIYPGQVLSVPDSGEETP